MLEDFASEEVQFALSRGAWTIEDEQCQRVGGGREAVNFGFLLFL
jgi:hypothetical protein